MPESKPLGHSGGRPHWFFWVLYTLTLAFLFVIGAAFGVLAGVNPYLTGLVMSCGGVLRATYQAQRGNFYTRWWDRG